MSTMHAILEIRDHYKAKLKSQRDEIRDKFNALFENHCGDNDWWWESRVEEILDSMEVQDES